MNRIFLSVLILSLTSAYSPHIMACDNISLEATLAEISYPGYKAAYEKIESISPDVFAGKVAPKWDDFNNIEQALVTLRMQNRLVSRSHAAEVLKKIKASLKNDPAYRSRQLAQHNVTLEPGQVEKLDLKLIFFDMIHDLNKVLPRSARFVVKSKPKAQRHAEYIEKAKKTVKKLSEETKKRFSKSEYKTPENVVKAIVAKGSQYNELVDLVQNEKVEFTMLRPSSGRWWIQRLGFQNQRVTGTSRGMNDNDFRDRAEAEQSLIDLETYETLSAEFKPNYGYMRPPLDANILVRYPKRYGDDIYIFDKTKLEGRVTWTFTDSLLGRAGATDLDWEKLMTPWSERELLLPYLTESFQAISKTLHPRTPSLPGFKYTGSTYTELQYWGPIDLTHVKKFVYLNTPPDDEFAATLRQHGIEIIDGRTGNIQYQNKEQL